MSPPTKRNEIIITDDNAIVIIDSPKYGKFNVIIDLDDLSKIEGITWAISKDQNVNDRFIAQGHPPMNGKTRLTIKLYHVIIGKPQPGMVVDHIDRDTMNNRKSNL